MEKETQTTQSNPNIDSAQLEELIKQSVSSSFKELEETQRETQRTSTSQTDTRQTETTDPWADIVNPLVEPRLAQMQLQTQAAQDKIDFYSSDSWLTELDEHLTSDDTKTEKADFRKEIEKTFSNLMQKGSPLPREDIAKYLLGQKLIKSGTKHYESKNKKAQARRDADLQHAQRAVEFQSGIPTSVQPQKLYDMTFDDIVKEYGTVQF